MITTTPAAARHPVEELAEDFLTRHRRGERPSLSNYIQQFPDVADELADIIQALLVLEGLGTESEFAAESTSPLPERLGEYRLIREIGRGGMGIVYEAEQVELGRHVALKILPAASLLRPTHLERFRREARAAARLHHNNIIPVYGVGEQNGIHYYAMQYISGRGLEIILRELRRQQSQPARETEKNLITSLSGTNATSPTEYHRTVAQVGLQVAEALAHAHSHGVLHRDVKPANVILDDQGTAWLGDFGLAYLEGDAPLTGTGGFVGTLLYLAPERFQGDGDARSDVYSLGATLYELLTLRPMFAETERARLIRQVTQDEPPPPRRIERSIPKDLETLVLKAIAKNPDDRYASSAALADDLRRFIADRPLAARRLSQWELCRRWVRRNPVVFALLTAVALSLCVGLGTTWWQWRRAESNLEQKTEALEQAEQSAQEAADQSHLAKAHGHRAHQMLDGLLTELNIASERQPVGDLRRRLMEKAFKVHESFINETPVDAAERLDVARLAREVGEMHRRLRQFPIANNYLLRALVLVEPEASDSVDHLDYRYMKARVLGSLGINYREQSLIDQANVSLEKCIEVYRQLCATEPGNRLFSRGLGSALHNRGVVAEDGGHTEQAIRDMLEAIAVTEPLVAADPDDMSVKLSVARFYQTLANQYLKTRRYDEARKSAGTALTLADQLEKGNPRSQLFQDLVGRCADMSGRVLVNQSFWVQDNDPPFAKRLCAEAEGFLHRAQAARQRLVEYNRVDSEYRNNLADTLCLLAMALNVLDRPADAEPSVRKAMQERNEALRLVPKNWVYLRGQASAYLTLGQSFCARGDHVKAAALAPEMERLSWGRGVERTWIAELYCECAKAAQVDAKLSTADQKQTGERYLGRALDQLRLAVRVGYNDRQRLERSIWLRPLRSRPDFQQLLQDIAGKKTPDPPVID